MLVIGDSGPAGVGEGVSRSQNAAGGSEGGLSVERSGSQTGVVEGVSQTRRMTGENGRTFQPNAPGGRRN